VTAPPRIDSAARRGATRWRTAKPALANSLADRVATWQAIELAEGDSVTALPVEALGTGRAVALAERTGWAEELIE